MASAQELIDSVSKGNNKREAEPRVLRQKLPMATPRPRHNVVRSIEVRRPLYAGTPQAKARIRNMTPAENAVMRGKYQAQERIVKQQRYAQRIETVKRLPKQFANRYNQLIGQRRIPIQRRSIQGAPLIPQEAGGTISRFISGRSPPRAESKGYSSRGRPKGTYKYYIPGVGPAGVFEWRKYQRYKQRLLAMQMQAQNPDLSLQQARGVVQQVVPRQISQQIPQQVPMQQQPIQQVPMQPQPIDDGWNLLRIKSPLTMTAPNRIVDPIANAQAPVGNKYTDYYSEPDFLSGQQVLKRRPNMGGFGLW